MRTGARSCDGILTDAFCFTFSFCSRLYEDFTFSNLGTDWPSLLEELEPNETANQGASAPPRRNRNPLRRVAGLASRLRGRA